MNNVEDPDQIPPEQEDRGTWQITHFENGGFDVIFGPDATPSWVKGTDEERGEIWSAAYAERKDEAGKPYWQPGLARTPKDYYNPQGFTQYGPEGLKFDSEEKAKAAAETLPEAVRQTTSTEDTNNIVYQPDTNSFVYQTPEPTPAR